jgi:lipoate-protein ligase B
MSLPTDNEWICVELLALPYSDALNLQHQLMAARKNQLLDSDIVLFLEHNPVFTLGKRGGIENLKVSEHFLEKQNISMVQAERGGDITFHGPGQLVVYPIVDLKRAKMPILEYVKRLENVMIRVANDWGIKAEQNAVNRGVWVGNNKLGSIGISVQSDICFHGFALNVNTCLEPFDWINPCGLQDIRMTSMQQELSKQVPMNRVRQSARRHLAATFGVKLVPKRLMDLKLQ